MSGKIPGNIHVKGSRNNRSQKKGRTPNGSPRQYPQDEPTEELTTRFTRNKKTNNNANDNSPSKFKTNNQHKPISIASNFPTKKPQYKLFNNQYLSPQYQARKNIQPIEPQQEPEEEEYFDENYVEENDDAYHNIQDPSPDSLIDRQEQDNQVGQNYYDDNDDEAYYEQNDTGGNEYYFGGQFDMGIDNDNNEQVDDYDEVPEDDSEFIYPTDVTYQEAKKIRNEQRQKYVELGKIPDPNKRYHVDHRIIVQGTCNSKCPQFEIIERKEEKRVDRFEMDPLTLTMDPNRMVQVFTRSAAGREALLPNELRTIKALDKTLTYLIEDVMNSNLFDQCHGFIRDRTRKIRNDISIQEIRNLTSVKIYEKITRFHILGIRHLISISDSNLKMEVEQLSNTLISLKEQYPPLRQNNAVSNIELEFWAYFSLNMLGTSPETNPFLNIDPQSAINNHPLVTFVQEIHSLYDLAVNAPFIIKKCRSEQSDPLHHADQFFSLLEQSEIPCYLIGIICEKNFDYIRYIGLFILYRLNQSSTRRLRSYRLQRFIKFLRFDNRDQAILFLTKYSFTIDGEGNNEIIQLDSVSERPVFQKSLVIGASEMMGRLHERSNYSESDLVNGVIDYQIPANLDFSPIYSSMNIHQFNSSENTNSQKPNPKRTSVAIASTTPSTFGSISKSTCQNNSNTNISSPFGTQNPSSGNILQTTSSLSTSKSPFLETSTPLNKGNLASTNAFSGSFPALANPSNPFQTLKAVGNNTPASNLTDTFQSGNNISQITPSLFPNLNNSKTDINPFASTNHPSSSNISLNFANPTSQPPPIANISTNLFNNFTPKPAASFNLSGEQPPKSCLINSPLSPAKEEISSPPLTPKHFQSFITYDWSYRQKNINSLISSIPLAIENKSNIFNSPSSFSPESDVTQKAQISFKIKHFIQSALHQNHRNQLISKMKKSIQEYASHLISVYLPITRSFALSEKYRIWKQYRKKLDLLASGRFVPSAYANFETGHYPKEICNRITFESKVFWSQIHLNDMFSLISNIKQLPGNHRHCITLCLPQSAWELHLWYKHRLGLEFDNNSSYLTRRIELDSNLIIDLRLISSDDPQNLFETSADGFQSSSYNLIYCLGLPNMQWNARDYWNQESSKLLNFLSCWPNKYSQVQSSLVINYFHPTTNNVSDFQYKSVDRLLKLQKFMEKMAAISEYRVHITTGKNLSDHPIHIMKCAYFLNSPNITHFN